MLISYKRALYNFKTIERTPYGEIHFTVIKKYTIISTFSKIRRKFKNGLIVQKAQVTLVTSYLIPVLNKL